MEAIEQNINLENNKKVYLPQDWAYRFFGNFIIIALIFSLAIITITIKHRLVSRTYSDIRESFYQWSSPLGFSTNDIIIENRSKTSIEEINQKLQIDRSINILSINIEDVKNKIEEIAWVKKAIVKRSLFPNIIHIHIVERNAISIWQINNKFHPIDEDGKVIEVGNYIPTQEMLIIVGNGAPENFKNLINVIKKDEAIFSRVKVASYISNRRWDVILDDIEKGVTIKLPEKDIEKAWQKLIKINNSDGILKRKLTNIDLRLDGKVIVKINK